MRDVMQKFALTACGAALSAAGTYLFVTRTLYGMYFLQPQPLWSNASSAAAALVLFCAPWVLVWMVAAWGRSVRHHKWRLAVMFVPIVIWAPVLFEAFGMPLGAWRWLLLVHLLGGVVVLGVWMMQRAWRKPTA